MNPPSPVRRRRASSRGIVLLEIVIAIAIFGVAAVGFMRALSVGAQNAIISQLELRMLLRLQSTLTEYSKLAQIEEGEWRTDPDDLGVATRTEIVKLEMENQDGQELPEMYHIIVHAYYNHMGQQGQMSAETWRYSRLYQNQPGAAAGGSGGAP